MLQTLCVDGNLNSLQFGLAVHIFVMAVCAKSQAQALLLELQTALMTRPGLRDVQRAKVLDALSVADKSLVDGADELLQLLSVSSQVQQALAQCA